MKYFIGIDGGGSKTQFILCDEEGQIHSQYMASGSSYKEIGEDAVCELLIQGVGYICAGIDRENIAGICFGMPCYGESVLNDARVTQKIQKVFLPIPVCFENDVVAAWAGALAFHSGIVMLAGTGSMAVGRDRHGRIARSGGWSEFFSDEGSCYWLGKKTLELFTKQSDNRMPKGKLYEIIKTHFSIGNDFELIEKIEPSMNSREKVASLQKLLMEAALQGDTGALLLYKEAAEELALMVKAVSITLDFEPGIPVSYAGGLFKTGELIINPFKNALSELDIVLQEPLLLPVDGAVLFAVENFDKEKMQLVKTGLLNQRKNNDDLVQERKNGEW